MVYTLEDAVPLYVLTLSSMFKNKRYMIIKTTKKVASTIPVGLKCETRYSCCSHPQRNN